MRIRRAVSVVFVSFGLLALGVTVAAPAQAEERRVADCDVKSNWPHPSLHVDGSINATGTIKCDSKAYNLHVRVTLEKFVSSSWTGQTSDRLNTFLVSSNAATSCSNGPGVFRTRVEYVVKKDAGIPGYSGTLYTAWKDIACGTPTRLAE